MNKSQDNAQKKNTFYWGGVLFTTLLFLFIGACSGENSSDKQKAQAQYELGKRYFDERNFVKATECFKKAAEQGSVDALVWINLNKEIEIRQEDKIKWARKTADGLKKAAEQGNAEAQMDLSTCYAVLDMPQEMTKWTRKAAEQGHKSAMRSLGILLLGKGELEEGVEWLEKAGQYEFLSTGYTFGLYGLPKNQDKANEYKQKADEIKRLQK